MGRARKVVDISAGKIGKAERTSRKAQEESLRLGRGMLEAGAPEFLCKEAAEEYSRVVAEAGRIGLLDNLDMAVLAIYANEYAAYRRAAETARLLPPVQRMSDDERKAYARCRADMKQAAAEIRGCSTKLGLSATDRLKLVVPARKDEKPANKYLKFLG